MIILVVGLIITAYNVNAQAQSVRDWWAQCGGNSAKSSCLSEGELSKFKTICSNRIYKEDCKLVVDYAVARTRVSEAKSFLLSGYAAQIAYFTENRKYLNEIEKIWGADKIDKAFSFAVGVLPSCNASGEKKLVFGKKLRPEVLEFQNEINKVYESLTLLPCPDNQSGFVLVAIGKVMDSVNEYEVFSVDERRNLKVIRTALGAGPFVSNTGRPGN